MGGRVEVLAVADGHEHVLELSVGAQGVVGIVGHDRGQAGVMGQPRQLRHQPVIVGQEVVLELHVEPPSAANSLRQPSQRRGCTISVAGQQPTRHLAMATAGEDDESLVVLGVNSSWLKRGTPLLPAR